MRRAVLTWMWTLSLSLSRSLALLLTLSHSPTLSLSRSLALSLSRSLALRPSVSLSLRLACGMCKGEHDMAIEAYLQALSTYRSSAGESHPQYITTLTNLGLCFQAAGLAGSALQKTAMMERSVETLEEALRLRKVAAKETSENPGRNLALSISGDESLVHTAAMHLSVAKFHGASPSKEEERARASAEAAGVIRATVASLRKKYEGKGPHPEVATALNNLGFVLKSGGQ